MRPRAARTDRRPDSGLAHIVPLASLTFTASELMRGAGPAAGLLVAMMASVVGHRIVSGHEPAPAAFVVATPQVAELLDWSMVPTDGRTIVAVQQGTNSSRPFFDTVDLVRISGTLVVTCGRFGVPRLEDNGAARSWVYEIPVPTGPPCAGAAGQYAAFGQRSGVPVRAARSP